MALSLEDEGISNLILASKPLTSMMQGAVIETGSSGDRRRCGGVGRVILAGPTCERDLNQRRIIARPNVSENPFSIRLR